VSQPGKSLKIQEDTLSIFSFYDANQGGGALPYFDLFVGNKLEY
jgi:hypothetical protein